MNSVISKEQENIRRESKPVAAWVRRLVEAQGVDVPEAELGWWSWHLQQFLRYAERKGEPIEAAILTQEFVQSLEMIAAKCSVCSPPRRVAAG